MTGHLLTCVAQVEVFFFFACKSFGGLAANLATLPDNLPFFLMPSTFSALLKPFIAANQSKGLM